MMPSTPGRVSTVLYNGMVTVLERSWRYYSSRPRDYNELPGGRVAAPPETAHTARNSSMVMKNRDPRPDGRGSRESSPGGASRDRKSTRLNSSHVKISYAVFCLKKK